MCSASCNEPVRNCWRQMNLTTAIGPEVYHRWSTGKPEPKFDSRPWHITEIINTTIKTSTLGFFVTSPSPATQMAVYHVWGVWNLLKDVRISLQQLVLLASNLLETWKGISETWLYFFSELKQSISNVGGLPALSSRCSGSLKRMSLECHIKIFRFRLGSVGV